MAADLAEKADRYERLLAEALEVATPAPGDGSQTPAGEPSSAGDAGAVAEMARSYLADGRHFAAEDDLVNALAAFAYGHGWLDAGARLGLFDVPEGDHRFTV